MNDNEKKGGFTHDSVDNKSVDWYTPRWIFDELGWVRLRARALLPGASMDSGDKGLFTPARRPSPPLGWTSLAEPALRKIHRRLATANEQEATATVSRLSLHGLIADGLAIPSLMRTQLLY